jgi:peptide/nickel transport system permease protein
LRPSPSRRLALRWSTLGLVPKLGVALIVVLTMVALVGPLLVPADPLTTRPGLALQPPSSEALMGTDQYGRDILARVVAAARLDMLIALLVVMLAAPTGILLGLIAGSGRPAVDQIISRGTDILLSFPAIILAMVIVAVLGNSVGVVVAALAIAYSPYFVRITRSRVLSERTREYVDAAQCVGNPWHRVVFRHLAPNCMGPALSQAALAFGWAILDTAGLAFLGVGIVAPQPEWGLMIGESTRDVLAGIWWTSVFPGLFIVLTVLAVNLVAGALKERT